MKPFLVSPKFLTKIITGIMGMIFLLNGIQPVLAAGNTTASQEALEKAVVAIKKESDEELMQLEKLADSARQQEQYAKQKEIDTQKKRAVIAKQIDDTQKKLISLEQQQEDLLKDFEEAKLEQENAKQTQLRIKQQQDLIRKRNAALEEETKAILKKLIDSKNSKK